MLLGCGSKPEINFEVEVRPIVSIQVNPGGSVTSATIARSSGKSRLDTGTSASTRTTG
ncbi:energy transducer TonB family protein [Dactylococcopsis salina]|uniref:energy transducer TonB family protein n=1 Tax=Dactylococcopsis salina TaxID=292566 RepID=UPI0012E9F5FB